jgi:hypothetical protein
MRITGWIDAIHPVNNSLLCGKFTEAGRADRGDRQGRWPRAFDP